MAAQWALLGTVLLPADLVRLVPEEEKHLHLAWLTGVGALVAAAVQPAAGALSDLWAVRMGSRRPLILWGSALNAVGLLGMAVTGHLALYAAAFLVMDAGSNAVAAAYHGLWRDQVPTGRYGALSGWVGLLSLLGYLLGLSLGGLLGGALVPWSHLTLVVVFSAGALCTLRQARVMARPAAGGLGSRAGWSDLRRAFGRHPDFRLACLHRFTVLLGFNLVTVYLAYYLKDSLGMADFAAPTATLGAVVVTAALAGSLPAGALCNRYGRRRPLLWAGAIMGLAVAALAASPAWSIALAAGSAFGLGYGIFVGTDLALAMDTLPGRATAARDLAVWQVMHHLARLAAPAVGGLVLHLAGLASHPASGYSALFLLAAVCFWLGSALVLRMRTVR